MCVCVTIRMIYAAAAAAATVNGNYGQSSKKKSLLFGYGETIPGFLLFTCNNGYEPAYPSINILFSIESMCEKKNPINYLLVF